MKNMGKTSKWKKAFKKYNHAWVLLYFFIYVLWFFYLNRKTGITLHPVEVPFDSKIPFLEWFIVPYYLWFAYIPLTILYFFFSSRQEFYRLTAFLFIGMTICLIAYTVWSNAVFFRPDLESLGRDNIFIHMTSLIYKADTGNNVCPSIHCFNSIGVAIAIIKSIRLKRYKAVRIGAVVLSISICLSTVFVKQHSIIDVFWAFLLAAVMYILAYIPDYSKVFAKLTMRKKDRGIC